MQKANGRKPRRLGTGSPRLTVVPIYPKLGIPVITQRIEDWFDITRTADVPRPAAVQAADHLGVEVRNPP